MKQTEQEVDNLITEWHTNKEVNMHLHEFLGWTKDQFIKYVEENVIPELTENGEVK